MDGQSETGKREDDLKSKLVQTKVNLGEKISEVLNFECNVSDWNSRMDEIVRAVSEKEASLTTWMRELESKREQYENDRETFNREYQQKSVILDQKIAKVQDLLEHLEFQSAHLQAKSDQVSSVAYGTVRRFQDIEELESDVNEHHEDLFDMASTGEMVQTSREVARLSNEVKLVKHEVFKLDKAICKARMRIADLRPKNPPVPVIESDSKADDIKEKMIEVMEKTADMRARITELSQMLVEKQREKNEIAKEIDNIKGQTPNAPFAQRILTKQDRMRDQVSKAYEQAQRLSQRLDKLTDIKKKLAGKLADEEKCAALITKLDAKIAARLELIEISEKEGGVRQAPFLRVLLSLESQLKQAHEEEERLNQKREPEMVEECFVPEFLPMQRKLGELTERLAVALDKNEVLLTKYRKVASRHRALKNEVKNVKREIKGHVKAQQVGEVTHNDNIATMFDYKMTVPDQLQDEIATVLAAIADTQNRIRERRRRMRKKIDTIERVVAEYGAFTRTGIPIIKGRSLVCEQLAHAARVTRTPISCR